MEDNTGEFNLLHPLSRTQIPTSFAYWLRRLLEKINSLEPNGSFLLCDMLGEVEFSSIQSSYRLQYRFEGFEIGSDMNGFTTQSSTKLSYAVEDFSVEFLTGSSDLHIQTWLVIPSPCRQPALYSKGGFRSQPDHQTYGR
ncbi:hypothetical protein HAX54_037443 [Datura stramonium]|uniref:Uncharacterized protein n=1 Tax=Datura stramonium TaxID=4076 RepID=A0ABS8VJN5_DATST|nr:hypothetical protein [Datura stramonium]